MEVSRYLISIRQQRSWCITYVNLLLSHICIFLFCTSTWISSESDSYALHVSILRYPEFVCTLKRDLCMIEEGRVLFVQWISYCSFWRDVCFSFQIILPSSYLILHVLMILVINCTILKWIRKSSINLLCFQLNLTCIFFVRIENTSLKWYPIKEIIWNVSLSKCHNNGVISVPLIFLYSKIWVITESNPFE